MALTVGDPITALAADLLAERGMPRTAGGVAELVRDVLAELGLEWVVDDGPGPDDPDDTLMGMTAAALGLAPRDDESDDEDVDLADPLDDLGREDDPDADDGGRPQPFRDLEED